MAHRNKPVVLTSDLGPRTLDSFPDTWHLIPDTCFSSPFVFMNISGCTFIFVGQETVVRSQETEWLTETNLLF
jgi:hypothetical protein